jgi:hypothetical protein
VLKFRLIFWTVRTEFMQEMDGLTSSGANKEARVSVVAATNRPFVSGAEFESATAGRVD